ncbi:MAG: glycine betaine ABC transporter substrate-binding protein [Bacillota bacterium]
MWKTKFRHMPLIMITISLAVVIVAVMGCAQALQEDEGKDPIIFSDRQWESVWAANEIAQFIIEEGYEHPTETETVSSEAFQIGMEKGDVDVDMELWRMNLPEWYDEATEEGFLIDVGPIYERSVQAWYVPRYVVEGDEERGIEPMAPDLETVEDLKDYADLFEDPDDPDRGRFINGISGWEVTEVNSVKMEIYGLDEHYNIVEPGSASALDSAIASAFEAGEPLFFYYWEPTWLLGKYDVVRIEEPEYDPDVRKQLDLIVEGELSVDEVDEACAFIETDIRTGVHSSLQDRAPGVFEFLEEMEIGTDPINQVLAYMQDEEADPEEAAMWYFENFEEDWRSWLPTDVEENVEDALSEAGVELSG